MYTPNLQVLSFPLYSFLWHWRIFHPVCKEMPFGSHSFPPLQEPNIIDALLSSIFSLSFFSLLTLSLLFYICSNHSQFFKKNKHQNPPLLCSALSGGLTCLSFAATLVIPIVVLPTQYFSTFSLVFAPSCYKLAPH